MRNYDELHQRLIDEAIRILAADNRRVYWCFSGKMQLPAKSMTHTAP
jgi:hypothetical protein